MKNIFYTTKEVANEYGFHYEKEIRNWVMAVSWIIIFGLFLTMAFLLLISE